MSRSSTNLRVDQRREPTRKFSYSLLASTIGMALAAPGYAANDIELVSGSTLGNVSETVLVDRVVYESLDDSSQIGWDNISGHLDYPVPNYVTISTTESGLNNQLGDVNVNAVIDPAGLPYGGRLGISAHNDINLNANITGNNYLNLELTPDSDGLDGGVVNLNADFSGKYRTTIYGGLVIGATGAWNLESSSSLTAASIDNSAGGAFNFTGGSLHLTDSAVAIDANGLLGATADLSSSSGYTLHELHAISQSVGTADVDSGAITVGVNGRNYVDGALTINSGGTYNLDGGVLEAGSIVNNGALNFTRGTLAVTSGNFAVEAGGALGANVVIGNGATPQDVQRLNVVDQSVGTAAAGSGSFTLENVGTNTVSGTLTINSGGTYNLSGGQLSAGNIVNAGAFNFTSGTLSLSSALAIDSTGLLGDNVSLGGRTLNVDSQTVGSAAADSGTLTIGGGSNDVANVLLINAGGTVNLNSGTLSASSITNNGQFNFTGGELTLRNQGVTVGASGLLGTDFALNTSQGLLLENNNVLTIDAGSTLTLNGGYFEVGSVVNNGSFVFNSGNFALTDSALVIGATGLLGANASITWGKNLDLTSEEYIGEQRVPIGSDIDIEAGALLSLDGGSIKARAITGNGDLDINTGSLELMSDMTVGAASPFGNLVVLGSDATLDNASYSIYFPDVPYGTKTLHVESGATVRLDGGRLFVGSIDNQGTFQFNSGSLELAGQNLVVGAAGLLGSEVTLGSNKSLSIRNNTKGVDIEAGSTLNLSGGYLATTYIHNAGTFNFNSGFLNLYYGATIGADSALGDNLNLTANRRMSADYTTVEAGATLRVTGSQQRLGRFTNNGTVVVDGGELQSDGYGSARYENNGRTVIREGSSLVVDNSEYGNTQRYIQNAGVTIVDGVLETRVSGPLDEGLVSILGGTLKGSGVIMGNVELAGGNLAPGNSPGTLEVTGDFTMTDGRVSFELGSDGAGGYLWDQLIVGGNYDLQGGQLRFSLLDGLDINDLVAGFTIGDFFRTGDSLFSEGFDLANLSMFGNMDLFAYDVSGDSWFSLGLDGAGNFLATPATAPVPVPAAVWLFGSGLLGLVGVARRRRAA